MADNVAHKLIKSHLVEGTPEPGNPIALQIDQTLTQDATGTLVMLELESMGIDRVKTELSAQYIDHNLLQTDYKNPDDHVFLHSACRKFGVWYSRPGNGVSHPVHMQNFGKPGKTMVGSDSHTPAAGSLGMLAIGAGGLEVALAMAGEPFHTRMPKIMGVELTGELPPWVSAKDVILEMLRRHGVDGGVGRIIEYHGPGLANLSAMDRHVIANMGAELGATTTVFPADDAVRQFLRAENRENDFSELVADDDATYDEHDSIDLSQLEPLIAKPSSPGNVVPVSEVAGEPVYQSYIGSSANPGLRDFGISALMVEGRQTADNVSFDVNPTSREILENLSNMALLMPLLHTGARLHQAGCNGCIGMGQAPASGRVSLRTVPRNFPGRSGTREDSVYLCSPETATAAALTGKITDPRTLDFDYPSFEPPQDPITNNVTLTAPADKNRDVELVKGPNIKPLPDFDPLPDDFTGPVSIKVGDDVSTDEIMPAGAKVLPFRSNIPEIAKFVFIQVDENYYDHAMAKQESGHVIVGGSNYGQGSSREHAALAPRHLGVRIVLVKSFARIHRQNLANFGILPLIFDNADDYDAIDSNSELAFEDVADAIQSGTAVTVRDTANNRTFQTHHDLSEREVEMVRQGSLMNVVRAKQ